MNYARQHEIADMLRSHLWAEQVAPDPEYSEMGQLLIDVGTGLDEFSRSIPVRIAIGMATGGASEVYFQGRTVLEAVKRSAELSTEWTFDPKTKKWMPPQDDFGRLDGLLAGMDANFRENVPGYGTARMLMDPNATKGDVAMQMFWDLIGARMARGQLNEAMDQVRRVARGGPLRPAGSVRLGAPEMPVDPTLPKIKLRSGQRLTTGHNGLDGLVPGQRIPNDLLHHTGWTGAQIDHMRRIAKANDAIIDARAIKKDSMRLIRNGDAFPKPMNVKPKTLTMEDYYLGGAKLDDVGKVGFCDPSKVVRRALPPIASQELIEAVNKRATARAGEFRKYADEMAHHPTAHVRNGLVYDRLRNKPYGGDPDAVAFRDATTGQPLSGERLRKMEAMWQNKRYQGVDPATGNPVDIPPNAEWQKAGPGQHGSEMTSADNVIDDFVQKRIAELDPTSPTYLDDLRRAQHEAYQQARNLQQGLLDNSLVTGRDPAISIGGDGPPYMSDSSWAGPQTLAGETFTPRP